MLLSLQNLGKSFGDTVVLQESDATVEKGERIGTVERMERARPPC